MAIKRAAATVEETPSAVASMNPDNMLSGGLMDDFDGTIVKARLVPWDYNGNVDHHVLAVALTIQPDDDEKPFVQHYSAGDLESFAPSMDGKHPVDLDNGEGEDLEGIYAIRVGKKDQLNNNSNWAHFTGAALDAGFERSNLGAAVTWAEGLYCHFNRVPQKKRSGIVVTPTGGDAKRARNNDVLVITEIKGAKATKATVAKTTKPAPATKAAPEAAGDDFDEQLTTVVTEAVVAAGESGLAKSKLASIAIKAFQGADKAKAVKRVNDVKFLESLEAVVFDADTNILTSIE
jgi:hypothetical protein